MRKKEEIGIFIGESSRSCHERANEHVTCAQSGDEKSFWLKHWANSHFECDEMPQKSFSVLKFHHNTLTRIVHEAVKIELEGNLNSRGE